MNERLQLVAKSGAERSRPALSAGVGVWLVESVREWLAGAPRQRKKQMRVVETLALGAKNKLVLVSCGGERFLVGTGSETIGTIVRVRGEAAGLAAVREQV